MFALSKSKRKAIEVKMNADAKNLKDCVTIFQCLGHFYFSFKNLTLQNRDRWANLKHTVHFIFLLLFLSSSMILFTATRKSNDYVRTLTAKNLLNIILRDATFASWVLEVFVGLIETYFATPLTKKFILTCLQVSEKFQNDFQRVIDHKAIRDRLAKQSFILVAYFAGTVSFHYFFSNIYLKDSSTESNYLFLICPLIFLTTLVLKFIFHIRLINTYLEAVCTILFEIFPKFSFAGVINGVFVKPNKAKLYRDTTLKLKAIINIYLAIEKSAELINRSMRFTLITMTTLCIVSNIAASYRLLMGALGENTGNLVGMEFINRSFMSYSYVAQLNSQNCCTTCNF